MIWWVVFAIYKGQNVKPADYLTSIWLLRFLDPNYLIKFRFFRLELPMNSTFRFLQTRTFLLALQNVTKASAFRFTDTRTVQNAAKERFFAENNRRDGVGVEFGMDLFKNQRDFSFVDTIHLQYLNRCGYFWNRTKFENLEFSRISRHTKEKFRSFLKKFFRFRSNFCLDTKIF